MLGEQVRNIRKKRGITLKELAEKTGLSIGYISQIERNLTDPSLSTLRKLSAALDIPTYLFMGGESSTGLTTRQADMMILSQPNSNIRYHLLTPMPNGDFVPQSLVIRFELEPHCKDGDLPVIHPSEEILLLEQGQLDVLVESETIRLNAGDTTVVQSNLPHIVSNPWGYHSGGAGGVHSGHLVSQQPAHPQPRWRNLNLRIGIPKRKYSQLPVLQTVEKGHRKVAFFS